jgi:HSP20 family protein
MLYYSKPLRNVLESLIDSDVVAKSNNVKLISDNEMYSIILSVPGLTKEDLVISIKDEMITIQYDEKEQNHFISSFKRTYNIPDDVNEKDITGKVENGILTITLPKSKKKRLERFISLN